MMESSTMAQTASATTHNMSAGGGSGGKEQQQQQSGGIMARTSPLLRRRSSRGLIAGGNRPNNTVGVGAASAIGEVGQQQQQQQDDKSNTATLINAQHLAAASSAGAVGTSGSKGTASINSTTSNIYNDASKQSASSSSSDDAPALPTLPKPNYSSRVALACVQNSLAMGVITKFGLCPAGSARKSLIARSKAARQKRQTQQGNSNSNSTATANKSRMEVIDPARDRAELEFLQNPPYRSTTNESNVGGTIIGEDNNAAAAEEEEEYSSGDEDDFDTSIENEGLGNPSIITSSTALHTNLVDARAKEPYFIPTTADAASMGLQSGQVPGMSQGKLPFNYRKIRYFDQVTADDRAEARRFLQGEIRNAKLIRSRALSAHLKKVRLREKEWLLAANESKGDSSGDICSSVDEGATDDDDDDDDDTVDLQAEQTYLSTALSRFPEGELTSTLSAALLIESLAMNKHESIEGMAKCYDGIVSAGTALLDLAASSDTNSTSNNMKDNNTNNTTGKNNKLTTSEIMGALAPLLITTLEQSSGEVFVTLAQLRDYCGSRRYQRRFVQRLAPFLVRPPDSALWCLRHQSDMEPIIAAVEMILDNATEVFGKGWYERGRNMLQDTKRAETLRSAASQLRRLNSPSPTSEGGGGGGGGLLVGLVSTPGSGLHHRRGLGLMGGVKRDGIVSLSNDSLADWEVEAINKSIRQSIKDVFSRDWGRISSLNLTPKESETPFGSGRSRRGISTAKSKEWQDTASASGAASTSSQVSGLPASITKSPRLQQHSKLPLSPRNSTSMASVSSSQVPSLDALESTFGPSFSSQNVVIDDNERPTSPTDYHIPPTAPLSPTRDPMKLATPKTPPTHSQYQDLSMPTFPDNLSSQQHSHASSPGRSAPLSPSASSIGNASTSSLGTLRSSTSTSHNHMSSSSNRDQYRALTSTAAERKCTVAACRALRAQITQFEDAFIQMHGRSPKGASERAPLASTYMQYREWKRAIRADAACRIQALCRGARVRLMLLRSADPRISSYMAKRGLSMEQHKPVSPNPPNHLSIPLDMGGEDSDSALPRRLETRDVGVRGSDDGSVEVVPVAPPSSESPTWRNRQQQQQQHSQPREQPMQRQNSGGSSPGEPHSRKSPSSRSRISLPDVSVMSLAELQQRKRELKQQLKLYDMNFHAQHGRMPEKREKEPIRHLYESYNTYKQQMTTIEKGEAQPGPGTAAFRGVVPDAPPVDNISPKAVSPTFASGNTSPINLGGYGHKRSSSGSAGASETGSDMHFSQDTDMRSAEVASQDMASLKAEKATLHQMLRSYEKDFFKQHKRQVSSFADIRPVASQYRRYKEIKKAIAQKSSGG